MTDLTLAAEFPALTQADWMKRVETVLKGESFADRLVQTTPDGFKLQPLYGQKAGARACRPAPRPWIISQRVDHPNATKANRQALDDLANGATGLTLVARNAASARGFGLEPSGFGQALHGIHVHAIALRLDGGGAAELASLIAARPVDPERLDISFGGKDPSLAETLSKRGFIGPFLEADGRSWHERGATDGEELGAVLGEAVGFLRQLESLNDAYLVRAVSVTLAASQDMFATLAKFRAMRLLWARVLKSCGLPDAPLRLHGETSWRMMAKLDPHTNILRTTAAVFGASLGGADSITVLPFSLAQGLPNGFARRVARNQQSILSAESGLWHVNDPALGAGYIETYTEALCVKAWQVFQASERGEWPKPDPQRKDVLPVIGTEAYRLPAEHSAEVEDAA
ncbi:MAG: methylmalonyl-CoA mutase family protein [Hyphomicrobiales bacterium]